MFNYQLSECNIKGRQDDEKMSNQPKDSLPGNQLAYDIFDELVVP